MQLKQSIASIVTSTGLGMVLGFGNSVISSRVLGPAGKGDFAIYSTAIDLGVLILMLGMNNAYMLYAARDENKNPKPFNTALLHGLVAAVVFFIGIEVFRQVGYIKLVLPPPYDGYDMQLLAAGHFMMLFLSHLLYGQQNSYKLYPFTSVSYSLTVGLTTVTYGAFWILQRYYATAIDFHHFYYAQFALMGLQVVMILIIYRMQIRPVIDRSTKSLFSILSIQQLRDFFRFALKTYLFYISMLLIFRFDFWFIQEFRSNTELGLYAMATNLGTMIAVVPNNIGIVIFTYIADPASRDSMLERTAFLSRMGLAMLIAGGLFCLLFIRPIIVFLYGDAFADAAGIFNLLLLGIIPYAIANLLFGYFNGANKVGTLLVGATMGIIITLVGDFFLIPEYGTTAAALTTVAAYWAMSGYLVYNFHKDSGTPFSQILILQKRDVIESLAIVKRLLKRG